VNLKEKLIAHFNAAPSTPFLFVGSGFSRRYLGLEDWEALLRKFCENIKSFEYYLASADADLAGAASLMAIDFHEMWWNNPVYDQSRLKNKARIKDKTSALRIEIANYVHSLSLTDLMASEYKDEVELLSRLNVDGIITTNWDLLLEKLFPDYKVFIGQSELLFSNPQSIAEIYKIHGSATRSSSMVLTREDYIDFEGKNPYLAAKLITLFVEHPIVFIGYSLTDKNIASLLKSIVAVLGADNIAKLQNNLIFVQRSTEEVGEYNQTYLTIDGGQIPITIVKAKSFVQIYESLDAVKRKIPARVLRLCKEQLYELVKSATPEAKLCVVDLDKIEKKEDVQFIVGVGLANDHTNAIGYQAISMIDLFKDVLSDEGKYDAVKVLENTVSSLGRGATYVPVFRYLRGCGIDTEKKYIDSKFNVDKHILASPSDYASSSYARAYLASEKGKDAGEIISSNPPEKAAIFLAYLPREKFDLELVRKFLLSNIDRFDSSYGSYSTFFRKLACLLDRYTFGWDAAAPKKRLREIRSAPAAATE
jgi:hypothetical protein